MDIMISAIIQVWYQDKELKNICDSLAKSMPNRILDLIKGKGEHIARLV